MRSKTLQHLQPSERRMMLRCIMLEDHMTADCDGGRVCEPSG